MQRYTWPGEGTSPELNVGTTRNSAFTNHLECTQKYFQVFWTREKEGGSNGDGPDSAKTRRMAKSERYSAQYYM